MRGLVVAANASYGQGLAGHTVGAVGGGVVGGTVASTTAVTVTRT